MNTPSAPYPARLALTAAAFFAVVLLVTACQPTPEAPEMLVALVADGRERTFSYAIPVTVEEFLRDAEVELAELDRVNPPPYTQITDGMRVTVLRVREEVTCEDVTLAFSQRTVLNEGLQPGEERLGQAGINGVGEVCYRVYIEDDVPGEPVEINRTMVTPPQDEVIYVGPSGELEPVPIAGTIAYINNRNAWVMRGSTTTKRPLTTTSDIDGRVFALSNDGLLMTRQTSGTGEGEQDIFNRLYLLPDLTVDAQLIELVPDNVLYADWVPNSEDTISYSTADAHDSPPGWNALNDLWIMRLDPATGESLSVREVVERSTGGLYGWWGTGYQWSPSGEQLAWIRADSIGLVDLETGELTPLLSYPVFNTFQSWSWRATVSWSPDNALLLTTVHGEPIGSEPPETSPAFHVAATDERGAFRSDLFTNAGIWANPRFSPLVTDVGSEFPRGYIAFLRCREFPNCTGDSAQYDLMLADRDGSNIRQLYPPDNQPGLTQRDYVWSPDGRQIAFIYQGNLWVIDAQSGAANQLTLDGGASRPVWMP